MYAQIRTLVLWVGMLLLSGGLVGCSDGSSGNVGGGETAGGTGRGGSMSRFAIEGEMLYAIAGNEVKLFDITAAKYPGYWHSVDVAFDIETLFAHREHLFIGAETGVHIYAFDRFGDLESVGTFAHVQSCDPVVVRGDYAYVTLRGASACSVNGLNQFDILDISDLSAPQLVASYDMESPMGLGVDGDQVFICDGTAGLKVYNVSDPTDVYTVNHLQELSCYDLIPDTGHLTVAALDGLYQYDYSDHPMELLSQVTVDPSAVD